MKAKYYESCGVFLGWSVPLTGAVLVIPAQGEAFTTHDHIDVRHLLEMGEYRNAEVSQ